MHPAAGHQSGQNTEWLGAFHAAENDIEIAMCEYDSSAM
tara:strand:- start:267 stop:383 length:117 start_codon:yes stop_codon:yes gene_type:complete